MYEWSTLSTFISGNKLVFLNQPMRVELFLVSLTVSLVESTGDIVMSVKGFANSTIIVFLATEVAM